MIDTHAHLDAPDFNHDRELVIKRSLEKGVTKLINISRNLELAKTNAWIFAGVGFHPDEAGKFNLAELKELLSNKKVVAIGECGLDAKVENLEKQKQIFKEQIVLAREFNLPLIIHCRSLHNECLAMLDASLKGVVHCFTGSLGQAQRYLEKGLLLSFTGIITYAADYDQVLKGVRLEKILLETDCPFLGPGIYRGRRSEPWMISTVAEKIAEVREISFLEVMEATTKNAEKLFAI